MALFHLEVTDVHRGQLNYGWVHRYLVRASSFRGAITKVARHAELCRLRKTLDTGNMAQWRAVGASVAVTGNLSDERHAKFLRERHPTLTQL